jgi:glutathione peroxidase
MSESVYNFHIKSLQGKDISFADFQGKIILVVNTASKCGFTPQYAGLQKLHEKYGEKGLVVIGFPCNQFGGQEPGSADEIQSNCLVNYGVTFLVTEKVDVNGANACPLFAYLKKELPGFLGSQDIKWNFTKFLIDTNGKPYKRYGSDVEPANIASDIENLLQS